MLCVSRKDDEELTVGSSLARIAVPHPVLQEPKSVQIMYTAYSGWISSGLAKWSIDKVTLTDSFGKRWMFWCFGIGQIPQPRPILLSVSHVCLNIILPFITLSYKWPISESFTLLYAYLGTQKRYRHIYTVHNELTGSANRVTEFTLFIVNLQYIFRQHNK